MLSLRKEAARAACSRTPRGPRLTDIGRRTDEDFFSPSPEGGADPKSDIRVFDVNDKRVTTLPGSVGMFTPHWSPDGRLIAAVRMNSRTLNIFDITTQRWSTPYTGIVAYPAWSKDGRSVYFLNFQDIPACTESALRMRWSSVSPA